MQRRAALLDAALDLIGTDGFAQLTVGGLCRRAGLNERYYYESFTDLAGVLEAVFDRIVDELAPAIVTAMTSAPADVPDQARAAIGAAVDLFAADPRKSRVAFVEGINHPVLARRRSEIVRQLSLLVMTAGDQIYGSAPSSATAPEIAATMLVGGLIETTMSWLDGRLPVTRDELVDRTAELFTVVGAHVAAQPANTG
ncbi:TetR/AcrR family transcriptional regulator [Skermania piniformis]|uniref:TetR/AcrR family transcriptional regulator n=2 Tax=Skermania pinensis TaxID=39122 RepID=A0ABX8SF64_9ACTN|nr:TetR/AcrR family transcriptional regulator [Skermania piniformis]